MSVQCRAAAGAHASRLARVCSVSAGFYFCSFWGVSLHIVPGFGLPIIRPFKTHLVICSHFKGKGKLPVLPVSRPFFSPLPDTPLS